MGVGGQFEFFLDRFSFFRRGGGGGRPIFKRLTLFGGGDGTSGNVGRPTAEMAKGLMTAEVGAVDGLKGTLGTNENPFSIVSEILVVTKVSPLLVASTTMLAKKSV